MAKVGKKYAEAAKLVDRSKSYSIEEAVALAKQTNYAKFDASVEVSFRLNVDPRHADQQIRGAMVLPNGTGKSQKVLVITQGAKEQEAKDAGADFVGTTMRGYTPETTGINDVDFGFIAQLARECPAKVIAEGHIHTPEQAVQALYAGAFALVVGGAITRPAEITARYTAAINNHK